MESSFRIDDADDLHYLHASGEVSVDGLIELVTRCRQHPAFRPGISSVCDLRESRGQWDFSEMQRFRDFIVHTAGEQRRRWAVVVNPGALAASLHVTILISQAVGEVVQMQVFDDPGKARRWARREND